MSGDTQNVFAVRGNWVLLICRFNEAVSCAWQRRGLHTAISGRYENARLGNSEGNDCSIIIKDFDQIDEGLWQCEGTKPGSMTPSQLSWTLTFCKFLNGMMLLLHTESFIIALSYKLKLEIPK